MANTKMTKKDYYGMLLNAAGVKGNGMLENFCKHEIELLNRKNGGRKMTKTQVENERIKENILSILNADGLTVTAITKALAEQGHGDYTPQKISALMRQLCLEGKANRIEGKKVTLFTKA